MVHDALVKELAKKKVLRGRKVRVDTTVVEADIHYPTDADLLADGVRVVARTVRKLQQAGIATGVRFRNVTRSVRKREAVSSPMATFKWGSVSGKWPWWRMPLDRLPSNPRAIPFA